MDELQGNSPIEQMSRTVNAIGVNMTKKRKNDLYYGKPPDNAYMGMNKGRTLANIHDLTMSEDTKKRLYGLGGRSQKKEDVGVGEFVNTRLENDSKSDLIRELVENSNMDRRTAEAVVAEWMQHNDLVEVDDSTFGHIIVPRGSR